MQNILQAVEWTTVARIVVSVGISAATIMLLLGKTPAASDAAIIGGLALHWVACTVDLTGASRIVLAGMEIERRVEMAEATIRRLQQAEADVQSVTSRMQELALLLFKQIRLQLAARYVRGTNDEEADINRTLEQLLEIAIPDATERHRWRQNFGTARPQPQRRGGHRSRGTRVPLPPTRP